MIDHRAAGEQQGFDDQNEENTYVQVHCDQATYTHGLDITKEHMRIHALSCKKNRVYVGKLTLGPWQLVLGI